MADTVRTLSALQTLLADNTSGDISPQDVRDMLVSTYLLDHSADVSVTTTATATIGKWHICSGTSADYTVTLPAASGNAGQLIGLRMSSALTKLVTIDGNSTELIDGSQTRVMWANEVAVLFCDGTGWTKIAGRSIPMVCSLARSADVSVTSNTDTKIALDTELIDNTGLMEDTANDRITIVRAGTYDVVAAVRYQVSEAIIRLASYANINAAATYNCMAEFNSTGTGAFPGATRPTLVTFAVNDWIELGAYASSNTTVNGTGTTEGATLTIREVSPW